MKIDLFLLLCLMMSDGVEEEGAAFVGRVFSEPNLLRGVVDFDFGGFEVGADLFGFEEESVVFVFFMIDFGDCFFDDVIEMGGILLFVY